MLFRKFVFIFILALATQVFSQQIYFCEDYTTEGEPVRQKDSWNVVGSEQTIYVILKAGDQLIKGPIVYMFIDKGDEGQYYPFDSKAIKFERDKEWLVYRYKVTESGKYSFYFQDAQENEIAQKYVTVRLSSDSYFSPGNSNSLYYEGSKVSFCEVVIEGRPINIRGTQSFSIHGHLCYIHINNFRPMNTSKILVYFWRKESKSFKYDEFFDTKKYQVSPEWSDAFFKYSFKETGDYKIIIYNENEMIIGNGFIQIIE